MAQSEREYIKERSKSGLESAKERGVTLGRPKGTSGIHYKTENAKKEVFKLYNKGVSKASISKITNISYPTVLKIINGEKL
jgi:DNA invertase Pin-like site-specific DNA recombinase